MLLPSDFRPRLPARIVFTTGGRAALDPVIGGTEGSAD